MNQGMNQAKQTSWSDLLKTKPPSAGDQSLDFEDPVFIDDVLQIDDETLEEGRKEWEDTVVGFFLDEKLSFTFVKKKLEAAWKLKTELDMSLDGEIYYFRLSPEEREAVIDQGPILMAGKIFVIKPWSPEIEENKGQIKTLSLWVKMWNVPKHLWNKKGISKIASSIGRPQFMDKNTEGKRMLSFTRVYIEVSAEKELRSNLKVKTGMNRTATIEFEYPWKPFMLCAADGTNHSELIDLVIR
ncbi:hypothetical protein ACHQM5_003203 [Ranunculus cassubicifolius]